MKLGNTNICAILFLFIGTTRLFSQEIVTSHSWEEMIEQLSEDGEEAGYSWENEIEELYDRIQEPLNLNTVTKEQLEQFPFLSDIQIESILAYLYLQGQMKTIYELQLVEGIDQKTIRYLLPFVTVEPVAQTEPLPKTNEILSRGKHEILTRLDVPLYRRKGYDTSYLGPAVYHSLRYAFRYKDQVYAGVTAEKDAGEPMFALHNSKGYDHYSFYLYLRNIRKLNTLAIGNYRVSFGQGLVISNDFMLGKSTTMSSVTTRKNQIKKHTSTDEYAYLRGVAANVQLNRFAVSAFYSHRALDGVATENAITSIQKTGLHRTQREADRRGAFSLQLAGGNIEYSYSNLKLGITGITYFFNLPYQPQIRPYSKYNIQGKNFHNAGINYKYRWNRLTILGEAALDKNNRLAVLNALNYSYRQLYKVMVIHRYYDYKYWNLFARSFSESGYVQNENGWYGAVEMNPFRRWTFFLSADFFSFPWWRYLVDAPSSGYDFNWQASFRPKENLNMFLRYRYKKKDKNYTGDDKVKTVRPLHHHRVRYQIQYAMWANVSFRSVFDYNCIYPENASKSHGIQWVQSVAYAFSNIPLRLELQGVCFKTDDYASRVYASEKGLLNTFYTPSFYGKGYRASAFVRYDPNRTWMFIVKYGQTTYSDRDEIGSGDDLINGNKKQDIQFQVRMKF